MLQRDRRASSGVHHRTCRGDLQMAKNIVVFSDGTGQEGDKGHNTNVYKLFNMALDRSPNQIAFYDRGLGTGWRSLLGKATGAGISQNIMECYEFIFENYAAGDEIYLFGFSRGATTVRSLSGFLHLFGILPKSRRELIGDAYKIYKNADTAARKAAAAEFIARRSLGEGTVAGPRDYVIQRIGEFKDAGVDEIMFAGLATAQIEQYHHFNEEILAAFD